jgi:hypothetical protein
MQAGAQRRSDDPFGLTKWVGRVTHLLLIASHFAQRLMVSSRNLS